VAQALIQTSFFGGELSQNLYGTVDLAIYKKSAALMRNFYPDYRGGASTRFGTKYVLTAYNSAFPVRLIPFEASFNVSYVMEFGQNYIRFHTNGGPVLEATAAISGVNVSGHTISSAGTYIAGDWIFVTDIVGVNGINGNYYIVTNSASPYTVTDLYGNTPVWSGSYSSGGTTARVYTITSPWLGADLALVKFAQNVQFMVLCHPNYPAQLLTFSGPTSWTLNTITFGSTIQAPTGISVVQAASSPAGWDTAYVVTAVDANGQESTASAQALLSNKDGIGMQSTAMTNTLSWSAVSGAIYYNIYRAPVCDHSVGIPAGTLYGLIASTQGTSFVDNSSGTGALNTPAPNFSITPPNPQNPFLGGPVVGATITTPGTYNASVPTVTFAAPPQGATALGVVSLGLTSFAVGSGGAGYTVGASVSFKNGVVLIVQSIGGGGAITAFQPLTFPGSSAGSITSGNPPGSMTALTGNVPATINTLNWGVNSIQITAPGTGYLTPPAVTFSSGAAAATAVLGPQGGNPSVPCYFQQRLVLAAPQTAPQTLYFSIPGSPYNFNTHQIIQANDAITAPLVSKELNTIKSMLPMPAGLVVLTSSSSWLINGGSGAGSPISPINISAQSQAYSGANDVPPTIPSDDILYVQSKGAIVRDLRFNFYSAVYTGTDISVLSEHLFFGYKIPEWAWAEEPFKLVWAVRSDGHLLSLTFSKEQELYGWAQHDTLGSFKSVTSIHESAAGNDVDAVYFVVERVVNGHTLKYIERMADRYMPGGLVDAWCLDCATAGTGPATVFTGLQQLEGRTVTALADGVPVTGLTVTNGTITLPQSATKVLAGLPYVPQLGTLPLDIGQPTIQGKRKRVGPASIKVRETRGLSAGRSLSTLIPIKDAGPPMLAPFPTMIFGDEWFNIDPLYDVYGQVYFQQSNPWPATILAWIPDASVGDTAK